MATPQHESTAEGSITVSGIGRVQVAPDTADLRLGVTVTRPTVGAARADAAVAMEAILHAVDGAGVPRRDVRTAVLSLQPRYDYRDGRPPTLTGYELANAVDVVVRDLARLGDVIDGTLGAGATSLEGPTFRLADPRQAEREARLLAMAEARARADVLAEAAGLSIIGVARVVEGTTGEAPGPRMKAERMMMAADVATPTEAGVQEVVVTVSVTYRTR